MDGITNFHCGIADIGTVGLMSMLSNLTSTTSVIVNDSSYGG